MTGVRNMEQQRPQNTIYGMFSDFSGGLILKEPNLHFTDQTILSCLGISDWETSDVTR